MGRTKVVVKLSHDIFNRLIFQPRSVLDLELRRMEKWGWILRESVCDLFI